MQFVKDNKQKFETMVLPQSLTNHVIELVHDEIGHNGSTISYVLIKRLYYWKGLKLWSINI